MPPRDRQRRLTRREQIAVDNENTGNRDKRRAVVVGRGLKAQFRARGWRGR